MKILKYTFLFCSLLTLVMIAQTDQSVNNYLNSDEFPGSSIYGRNNYIQYIPGTLPLVLSAPHGGYKKPDELKDRAEGTDHHDKLTIEVALSVQQCFYELTGKYPYVILNRLHRIKLDPNREINIAAQGDSLTQISYNEFHNFIEIAETEVEEKWGTGLYIDIHGHNHKSHMYELGYLLEGGLLDFSDEELNDNLFIEKSSLRNLAKNSTYKFSEILRGDVSFGAYLSKYGYKTCPSPLIPSPGTDYFYSGGYNTQVHGTPTPNFNGFQIELPWDHIPNSEIDVKQFSTDLMNAIIEFMKTHYDLDLTKM